MTTHKIYYDPGHLLSLMDADGYRPPIYMVEGNRTAGKTYGCKRVVVRDYLHRGAKFIILERRANMIKNAADYFIKDLRENDYEIGKLDMTQKPLFNGLLQELFFDGKPCGYVVPMNRRDLCKKASSMFVDVENIFLDEFQSESLQYAPDEYGAFSSILGSVSRGGGKQSRYVRTIMCSNSVSIFNPYYGALGIDGLINKRQKVYRGKGWVLERTYNEHAARAYAEAHKYETAENLRYACSNDYLLDKSAFVEKVKGQKRIVCVIRRNKKLFGVWMCNDGRLYVSNKYDPGFAMRITLNAEDHDVGDMLVDKGHAFYRTLFSAYMEGRMVFDSQASREAYIRCVSKLQNL